MWAPDYKRNNGKHHLPAKLGCYRYENIYNNPFTSCFLKRNKGEKRVKLSLSNNQTPGKNKITHKLDASYTMPSVDRLMVSHDMAMHKFCIRTFPE